MPAKPKSVAPPVPRASVTPPPRDRRPRGNPELLVQSRREEAAVEIEITETEEVSE